MYILGISYGFVATAVLLKDGKVIACASEERFNGIKNYNGFPQKSISYCLSEAGIKGEDLDLVTTPYTNLPPSHFSLDNKKSTQAENLLSRLFGFGMTLRKFFRIVRYYFPNIFRPLGQVSYRFAVKLLTIYYAQIQKKQIANYLKISVDKIVSFDHHISHAAAGYYSSSYNQSKALVLTLDGEGDGNCATVSVFEGAKHRMLSNTPREYSIGYIYGYVTKFLGMKPHEHEYKVMGLAPYAKEGEVDKVYSKITDFISLDRNDPLKFVTKKNSQDFDMFLKKEFLDTRFDNLAGAFQRLVEENTKKWIEKAQEKTKIKTVILSGGVFMNIKVNQVVASLPKVKRLFIMPSCADETGAIGSSYLGYLMLSKKGKKAIRIEPISHLYWGPSFSDSEIFGELKPLKSKVSFKKVKDVEKVIAKLLSEGKIVANLSGRMEFGARALGNRSILANPTKYETVKIINEQIKSRDFWMPFAPTILKERQKDYIVNPKNIDSPYMMLGFNTTKLAQEEIKAALHPSDSTCRPQILDKTINHRYYRIIKEFEKLTGIGAVLNTSFNIHGFPIVLGPKEALIAFLNSGLQYLVMENYLITKKHSHAKY